MIDLLQSANNLKSQLTNALSGNKPAIVRPINFQQSDAFVQALNSPNVHAQPEPGYNGPRGGSAKGTNYDPYDPNQTDPNRDKHLLGIGAAGIKMMPDMVAVPRDKNDLPILPYGTVVHIPSLNKNFLVADLKQEQTDDMHFDFPTPGKKSQIIADWNKNFDYRVVEIGKGRADARAKATSGSWRKIQ